MESISEAFSKCFVADFIFSVSRTVQDKTTNSAKEEDIVDADFEEVKEDKEKKSN